MKVEVGEVVEYEDGSADYVFILDREAVLSLARIGLVKAFEEAADKYGHINPKGSGNPEAGEDGDPPVHGEFPGF